MPFIADHNRRSQLDGIVSEMIRREMNTKGELAYVLYAHFRRTVTPSWNNMKAWISEVDETLNVVRYKHLMPYEDQKELENGGIK